MTIVENLSSSKIKNQNPEGSRSEVRSLMDKEAAYVKTGRSKMYVLLYFCRQNVVSRALQFQMLER